MSGYEKGAELIVISPVIIFTGYILIKNYKTIYNFYKTMFGERNINPTYMAIGVVLLVILFQTINKVACPKFIAPFGEMTDEIRQKIAEDRARKSEFICGSNFEGLSMIRYISLILFLIIAYYLYKNKVTENKLLALSTIVFAMRVIIS